MLCEHLFNEFGSERWSSGEYSIQSIYITAPRKCEVRLLLFSTLWRKSDHLENRSSYKDEIFYSTAGS